MNTIDDWIRTLEMRVERLETWAGPGQNESLSVNIRAIRADLVAFRRVQNQHGVLLGRLNEDVAGLKADVAGLKADVAGLNADVAELRSDVAELRSDVAELRSDVAELRSDVAGIKSDVAEMKAAIEEVLRRLPAAD